MSTARLFFQISTWWASRPTCPPGGQHELDARDGEPLVDGRRLGEGVREGDRQEGARRRRRECSCVDVGVPVLLVGPCRPCRRWPRSAGGCRRRSRRGRAGRWPSGRRARRPSGARTSSALVASPQSRRWSPEQPEVAGLGDRLCRRLGHLVGVGQAAASAAARMAGQLVGVEAEQRRGRSRGRPARRSRAAAARGPSWSPRRCGCRPGGRP